MRKSVSVHGTVYLFRYILDGEFCIREIHAEPYVVRYPVTLASIAQKICCTPRLVCSQSWSLNIEPAISPSSCAVTTVCM